MFHGLKRSDTLKLKKSNATGCSINVSLKARKAALIRKPASMEVDIDSASEIHTASESLCEATSTNSKLPRLPEIFRTHSSSSSSTVVASTPYALVSSSSSSVPRMSLTSTKPVTTTTANNIINNGNDEEEPIVTDELQDFISQFSTTSRQRRASTTIVNNVVNRQQLRRCSSIHVALSSPAKMTLAIRALNQLALCGIDYRESLLNGDGEECGALRKSVDPSPEDESEHREAARYRWKL